MMNSGYRESIKLAITSFFMFLLFIGISFYPLIIPDKLALINSGLALPILYMIEFSLIIPLYFILFRKHDEMNIGKGSFKMFFTFLILLILTQFAGSYIMDIRKPESWMIEQDAEKGNLFLLNLLLLIFIVPVYEELIFRGCLLRTMLISFRGNVYLSSLATSIVFSVLHTQYNDIRTFVILINSYWCSYSFEWYGNANFTTHDNEWHHFRRYSLLLNWLIICMFLSDFILANSNK